MSRAASKMLSSSSCTARATVSACESRKRVSKRQDGPRTELEVLILEEQDVEERLAFLAFVVGIGVEQLAVLLARALLVERVLKNRSRELLDQGEALSIPHRRRIQAERGVARG